MIATINADSVRLTTSSNSCPAHTIKPELTNITSCLWLWKYDLNVKHKEIHCTILHKIDPLHCDTSVHLLGVSHRGHRVRATWTGHQLTSVNTPFLHTAQCVHLESPVTLLCMVFGCGSTWKGLKLEHCWTKTFVLPLSYSTTCNAMWSKNICIY